MPNIRTSSATRGFASNRQLAFVAEAIRGLHSSSAGAVALMDRAAGFGGECLDFGQIALASSSNAAARRTWSLRASTPSS